ncbi:PAS domain S-box protein [Paraburkholderia sp. A1RI-2L]|uniref:helix-turn-helix transcriptional regulator n=1 Tax=Paraburkholderia sp. A1RI-2L TaxID=3028367 RepID=UPI003B78E7E1
MNNFLSDDAVATFADSLPDAVFLVDTAGKIRYVNATCEEILAYRQSDMINQSMIELVVPEDREATLREAGLVLAGHKRIGFENRYRHQDGSAVVLTWSARWLATRHLRIGVARDVTELRRSMIKADTLDIPCGPVNEQGILAPYERRVLKLLLTEATEKQIAERLGLAVSTTHSYITGIYRKFGVRGRAGLMSRWLCCRAGT